MEKQSEKKKTIKPLGRLFKWLRGFWIAYVIGSALTVIGCILMLNGGSSMFSPGQDLTLGDGIQGIGAIIYLFAFIGSVILFCVFSFRAVRNLKIFGANDVTTSPGWAVGWYFIPIANLWKPFGVMEQVWYGSHDHDEGFSQAPKTMIIWWGAWIISNIASNASFRMTMRSGGLGDYATDVSLYKTSLMLDIFSGALGIIAALAILPILQRISMKQDQFIQADAFD